MAGTVRTVDGALAPQALGRVLMHEHLLALLPGPWFHRDRDQPTGRSTSRCGH